MLPHWLGKVRGSSITCNGCINRIANILTWKGKQSVTAPWQRVQKYSDWRIGFAEYKRGNTILQSYHFARMEYNSSCSRCRGRNGCKIAATARVDSLRAHGSSFPVWTKSITCRIRNCLECGGLVPQSCTQKHQQDHSEHRKTTQTGSNFDNSTGLQQWKRMKWNMFQQCHCFQKELSSLIQSYPDCRQAMDKLQPVAKTTTKKARIALMPLPNSTSSCHFFLQSPRSVVKCGCETTSLHPCNCQVNKELSLKQLFGNSFLCEQVYVY